jgi:MtaA/CmuA family methyltransferase
LNSFDRVQNRLRGKPVDHPPNFDIFMTFAAHHIGQPLSKYYLDHRVLVEANLAVAEDFKIDILQAISDPYREATGFGLEVDFPHDAIPVPQKTLIEIPSDLHKLKIPNPYTSPRMLDRLEAVRLFREKADGEIPVMGWVEGALAEAADLRGVSELMGDLVDRPEWVLELLEICAETSVKFAIAQMEAGADIIGLGDAVASLISPAMYRKFALPYEQRVFNETAQKGRIGRLHICGNTSKIVADMIASGAQIIDLDWMVDMEKAAMEFGERISFCGNFDPVAVMLQGSPDDVYSATQDCVRKGGNKSFSAAGCEVPDRTQRENILAQHKALLEFD